MAQQFTNTGMNGQPISYQVPNTWAANNPYNQPMQPSVSQGPIYLPQQAQIQQQPQQQMQPMQPQQVPINSHRIWVQGEGSAKAFIVANNTEQELWDSEQPVIYLKTVDATGKPSMVVLDYTIRNPQPEYDESKETAALKSEINELKSMMKELMDQNRQRNNYKSSYNKVKQGGDEQ